MIFQVGKIISTFGGWDADRLSPARLGRGSFRRGLEPAPRACAADKRHHAQALGIEITQIDDVDGHAC
jgi:hypothetical protein